MANQESEKSEPSMRVANVSLVNVEKLAHTGIYSTVWRGNTDNETDTQIVIKRHHISSSMKIDQEIAEWEKYKRSIMTFQDVTGITVPESIAYEIKGDEIYFVEEMAGLTDVSKLLGDRNTPLDVKYKVIAELFRSLSRIPRDQDNHTTFMIDGKLSNFCFVDGGFVYVDTFPAHRRANSKSSLLYPSDDHVSLKRNIVQDSFVTGDMRGILGRFLNQLHQRHSGLWRRLSQNSNMVSAIEDLPSDLREYVVNLIDSDVAFIRQIPTMNVKDPKVIDNMLRLKKGVPI